MPWGYAIAAVGTYLGSQSQSRGARHAADAEAQAAQLTVDEQRRQYDQTRADMAPWLQQGGWALDQQRAFLNGDRSGFMNSPDYAWSVDQGMKTLDRSAASHGGLFGGAHSQDLVKFGEGNAQQYADNYYNKLTGLSQTGYNTGNALGGFGQNMANSIGNAYTNAGNARASSYINQANSQSNMWNSLGQIGSSYFGNRNGRGG